MKTTFERPNAAKELIYNNWNIAFSNPEPARAGENRMLKRILAKVKANQEIPKSTKVTRQMKRHPRRLEPEL